MSKLPRIASLWIGPELSWLEQLCLKSFADHGHEVTLYSYDPILNLPKGVKAGDAAEFYPKEPMLRHARTGSPAIHADMWRLHMIAKSDQIWVDSDILCTKPFDFKNPYVFGWEKKPHLVCNAVLGLPHDSKTLAEILEFFEDEHAIAPWLKEDQIKELEQEKANGTPVHITEQNWGFTGPASITYFLIKTGEIEHALEQSAFYPILFSDRNKMIMSRQREWCNQQTDLNTHAVHLWARRMKPRLQEKENNTPRVNSLLDLLMKKHEINPADAPIPEKIVKINYDPDDQNFRLELGRDAVENNYSVDKLTRKYLVDKQFAKKCIQEFKDHNNGKAS